MVRSKDKKENLCFTLHGLEYVILGLSVLCHSKWSCSGPADCRKTSKIKKSSERSPQHSLCQDLAVSVTAFSTIRGAWSRQGSTPSTRTEEGTPSEQLSSPSIFAHGLSV